MREDRNLSPVISTYAVGYDRSTARDSNSLRHAGRSRVLPAVAMVVTASAVAMTFASGFEGPNAPTTVLGSGAANDDKQGGRNPAMTAFPALPVGSAVPLQSLNGFELGREPSLSGEGSFPEGNGLPLIAAIHAQRDDATTNGRTVRRARPSAARTEAISNGEAATPISSSRCEPDCSGFSPGKVDGERRLAVAAESNVGPRSTTRLSSYVTTRPDPAVERPLTPSRPGPEDEVRPESGLLVDAQPAVLLARAGQLVVDMPAIQHALAERAASTVADVNAAVQPPQMAMQQRSTAQSQGPEVGIMTNRLQGLPDPIQQASSESSLVATSGIDGDARQVSRVGQPPSAQSEQRSSALYTQAPASVKTVATDRHLGIAGETLANPHSEISVSAVLADKLGAAPMVVHDSELVSIKLGDLVSLFEDRLDRPLYIWMKESKSASKYVTVETLAAAGIGARYDPDSRQVVFSVIDE